MSWRRTLLLKYVSSTDTFCYYYIIDILSDDMFYIVEEEGEIHWL